MREGRGFGHARPSIKGTVGPDTYAIAVTRNDGRLLERPIDFGYAFQMRCSQCDRSSTLTGADYLYLNDHADARMACQHCPEAIHFGPLVADIRDERDGALDDELLNRLSWYHSSTYPDWPSAAFEVEQRALLSTARARALLPDVDRHLSTVLDMAPHVGTYEAAVENMYRRMRNQGDSRSQFYLHRVEVAIRHGRVNAGFRDENHESAAQLTVSQLDDLGLDAVRYLNVWEASGSLSLAVRPDAIVAIQSIPIPTRAAVAQPVPAGIARLIQELELRRRERSISDADRLQQHRLRTELIDGLISDLLPDVNPVVADRFAHAVWSTPAPSDVGELEGLASRFSAHATLLTDPAEYLRLLDEEPPRRPSPRPGPVASLPVESIDDGRGRQPCG